VKDRLYTSKADGKARRSAQTVLWCVAHDLLTWLSPILSFTASEGWGHLPGRPEASVFLAGLPVRQRPADAEVLQARYGQLFEVRAAVQVKLEEARKAGLIGKSLEAAVTLTASGPQAALLASAAAELPALLIVSKVTLAEGPFAVEVAAAPGEKCARCWMQSEEVGRDATHPALCGKCVVALS